MVSCMKYRQCVWAAWKRSGFERIRIFEGGQVERSSTAGQLFISMEVMIKEGTAVSANATNLLLTQNRRGLSSFENH